MEWICDNCYSIMEETKEEYNRYKVECPNCGTLWYVDKGGEMLNDGSDWSPRAEEKIPEGCAACGGPYPSCKTSCPIFDD